MHTTLMTIRERLLDAADLMIDFATLGEFGLEPTQLPLCERRFEPSTSAEPCRAARAAPLAPRGI